MVDRGDCCVASEAATSAWRKPLRMLRCCRILLLLARRCRTPVVNGDGSASAAPPSAPATGLRPTSLLPFRTGRSRQSYAPPEPAWHQPQHRPQAAALHEPRRCLQRATPGVTVIVKLPADARLFADGRDSLSTRRASSSARTAEPDFTYDSASVRARRRTISVTKKVQSAVEPRRLVLGPDCGLRPSVAHRRGAWLSYRRDADHEAGSARTTPAGVRPARRPPPPIAGITVKLPTGARSTSMTARAHQPQSGSSALRHCRPARPPI